MKYIKSDLLPKAIGPYSQAIVINGMLYSSGQIPLMLDGTMVEKEIKAQTKRVLNNIKNLLESSDSSMNNVVKVTIYLSQMKDFGVVNVLFAEFFGEHKPARSTVAVKDLPLGALIEMDVVATVDDYI